jgi:hypothetical protein
MWRLNKLFQATFYYTERWNIRKQNLCEPGLTTSWKPRHSIADRARNSFPYTPSGHTTSKPQVVRRDGRKFTLRSIPKASVDLPTLQLKEIGMCQCDRNCVQNSVIRMRTIFPSFRLYILRNFSWRVHATAQWISMAQRPVCQLINHWPHSTEISAPLRHTLYTIFL